MNLRLVNSDVLTELKKPNSKWCKQEHIVTVQNNIQNIKCEELCVCEALRVFLRKQSKCY